MSYHQVARFPAEEAAIDQYFSLVRDACKSSKNFYVRAVLPRWLQSLVGATLAKRYMQLSEVTVSEVLQTLTTNKELIGVLG